VGRVQLGQCAVDPRKHASSRPMGLNIRWFSHGVLSRSMNEGSSTINERQSAAELSATVAPGVGPSSRPSHTAKAGADFFQRTAGAVEQLWRSGLDMASHFADRSSTQVARSMGSGDEEAHQATEQSWRNIDAIVQSSRAYADALQSVSREMSNFCREGVDRNLERMNALMRSRTPQEFIAAQSDLLRDNFEGILQSSRRVAQA
jgi:hypothetical protein